MKVRWLETTAGKKLQYAREYGAGTAIEWIDVPTEPIVPEDKTLEEKLKEVGAPNYTAYADIARDHFVGVAEKAIEKYCKENNCSEILSDLRQHHHIITALKESK